MKWSVSCSASNSLVTPWTVAHQAPLSMGFSSIPMGSQRVGPDWSHLALRHAHITCGIFSSLTRDWTRAPWKWELEVPWTTGPPGKSPDTFLTKRLGQKGWTSLLRWGYKNTLAFVSLAFSQSLTCSEMPLRCLLLIMRCPEEGRGRSWQGTCGSGWIAASSCRLCQQPPRWA